MEDYYFGHINGVPYKMHCFIEMQFAAYFYTVVSYQALFRLSVYKNSTVSKSVQFFGHFVRYAISVPQLLFYMVTGPLFYCFDCKTGFVRVRQMWK